GRARRPSHPPGSAGGLTEKGRTRSMNIRRAIALSAAVVVAVGSAAVASAAPPSSGSGESILLNQIVTSSRQADGNLILEIDALRVLTGALSGNVSEHFRDVVHPDGVVSVK